MSYLVLARKYRPRTFSEVVGQSVHTDLLRGAILEGRIGHAYLFAGPRGTGKTTTARIFAKALNCEQGPAPDPCGECERCVSTDSGAEVDVVEIDAASNTGVDNIRDLRDQAAYVPLRARHKIYIVDEVHMLSKGAFNALLKTLEEPPAHVKFLFATTELHKVPDTILSRCQVLRLAPIAEADIVRRLDEVFAAEGVAAEPGVTLALAKRARGGMRDALSLADQLLALVGSSPRLADVARLAEGAGPELARALVELALAGDRAALLRALPRRTGGEAELVAALLDELRGALVAAVCGTEAPELEAEGEDRERFARIARAIGAERLELWLEELLAARERMRTYPAHGRIVLELVLLDLARPETTIPLAELERRLAALEARLEAGGEVRARRSAREAGALPATAESEPSPAPTPDLRAVDVIPAAPRPAPGRLSTAKAWELFVAELADKAPSLAQLLAERGKLVELSGERAVIALRGLRDKESKLVADERNRKLCAAAFARAIGREVEVRLQDVAGTRPGRHDPFTQEVADLFSGRIEDET